MRLGVVIPCYNHASYIGEAIESVLGQTRKAERFLVIDDGSKDDSVEVIKSYADRGVELIVQKNAGAHNTINRAVEIVAEDCTHVSILNSDDRYLPERFEKLLPVLEDNNGPAVVSSNLQMIDSDGALLGADESRTKWLNAAWAIGNADDISTVEWMAMANFVTTSSNIIARDDYLRANPFQPYRFNHDYFFLSGAALRDEIAIVEDVLLDYRVHPQNNINTDPAPLLKEMLRMHLDLYSEMAGELTARSATRERFYRYMAAAQNNVSSFHGGLFQVLLAQAISESLGDDAIEGLVDDLDPSKITELNDYPNKALVNTWDGSGTPQQAIGLAEKYESLRKKHRQSEEDRKALKELAKLRAWLLENRKVAILRALGLAKDLAGDNGSSPLQKLTNLKKAIAKHGL